MLTKYGYNTLGIIAIISFLLIAFSIYTNSTAFKYLLVILSLLLLGFSLNFFRDPDRNAPLEKEIIISPADGKVMLIKKVQADRYLNQDAWQISIFMSPLDVHVNRIPVSGKVEYLNYIKGKFLTAFTDKADKENERMEIGIKSDLGKVLFTQVAGFIARRIITELELGQKVNIGERFGMIKFGSRVDVLVPLEWSPVVKEGEKVKAGESIIYRLNK
ncbi:MAG: phosphatidylserine decarboxylase family protein [Melioribacteraceae bacterium]|nr:phosphatidylserine decarboxylase family protein [Melioribacteraceae bacterium]